MKPQLGQQAQVYQVGKSTYAITKPGSLYNVYRLVRGSWQAIESAGTYADARLVIFKMSSVLKGSKVI